MYIPEIYKNADKKEIEKFIHDNGFGILINISEGKPFATHIPLLLTKKDKSKLLIGHISKENPQSKSLINNKDVLVIFNGPHAYISSSWYDHENVPTWNYIAVHIYGTLKIHDWNETLDGLEKLIDKYEVNSSNPVKLKKLSEETMLQAKGIVSFEIKIKSIEAIKKLSQNRDDKNYINIINELEKTNDNQNINLANEMKNNRF